MNSELSILKALARSGDLCGDYIPGLDADLFTDERHKEIFKALKKLHGDGLPIGEGGLPDALDEGLWHYYFDTEVPVYQSNLDYDIQRLRINRRRSVTKFKLEKLLKNFDTMQETDITDSLHQIHQGMILSIEKEDTRLFADLKLDDIREDIFYIGIPALDRVMLSGGRLITIASRTHVGKTTLSVQIARQVRHRYPVLFLSTETDRRACFRLFLTMDTGISESRLMRGSFTAGERKELEAAIEKNRDSQIYFEYVAGMEFSKIRDLIYKYVGDIGVKVVILDYLGNIRRAHGESDRAEERLGIYIDSLKEAAVRLGFGCICTAQLNRFDSKRPRIENIRSSDVIAHVSDAVILPHRDVKGNYFYYVDKCRYGKMTEGEMRGGDYMLFEFKDKDGTMFEKNEEPEKIPLPSWDEATPLL